MFREDAKRLYRELGKEDHQDSKATRHWRSEEILAEHPGARDQPS